MRACKYCEQEFEWGYDEQEKRFIPLVPLGQDAKLERTHVDANGKLRAAHRLICTNNRGGIAITKLDRPIPAALAENHGPELTKSTRRRKTSKKNKAQQELEVG